MKKQRACKETLNEKKKRKKQTLVAEERARELGKLRTDAHDLLTAEQLLRDERCSTTNDVATEVNNNRLTLEHPECTQKHNKNKKKKDKKGQKEKKKKTRTHSLCPNTLYLRANSKGQKEKTRKRKKQRKCDDVIILTQLVMTSLMTSYLYSTLLRKWHLCCFFLSRRENDCKISLLDFYTFLYNHEKRIAIEV